LLWPDLSIGREINLRGFCFANGWQLNLTASVTRKLRLEYEGGLASKKWTPI
jgi:hypothetical protein